SLDISKLTWVKEPLAPIGCAATTEKLAAASIMARASDKATSQRPWLAVSAHRTAVPMVCPPFVLPIWGPHKPPVCHASAEMYDVPRVLLRRPYVNRCL